MNSETSTMQVAIVAYALNIGGMESFLFGLAEKLRRSGVSVTFVVTQSVGAWHHRPGQEGFPIQTVLPGSWESRRGHARRVARILEQFDAVILNHSVTAQSALGTLSDSAVTVSVLHNDDDPVYAVGLANVQNVDSVVAVSGRVLEEAILRGSPADRSACIRNGVDVFPSYPKEHLGAGEERPLKAVYVGRMDHRQKGVLYLPGMLEKALQAGASLSLDLIGSGDNDFELLRQQLSELEKAEVVTFHGAVPHDRAMDLLLSADVLIMPSHYEGQPIILFEAMARGVVPIVSLLPGITDTVVDQGQNGLVVPVGDEAGFAAALLRMDKERHHLAEMSRCAWKTALENFSNDAMTQQYLQMIDGCRLRRKLGQLPPRTGKMCYEILGKASWRTPILYRLGGRVERLLERLK